MRAGAPPNESVLPIPQWADTLATLLATTFAPAQRLHTWTDQPRLLPGFQVQTTHTHVIIRYRQPHVVPLGLRRATAATMIAQYRQFLHMHAWQVEVIATPRALPYLCCGHPPTHTDDRAGAANHGTARPQCGGVGMGR